MANKPASSSGKFTKMSDGVISINPHYNKGTPNVTSTSGGGGGGMESRIAKLEASVEHIQSSITDMRDDVRDIRNWGFGLFIAVCTLVGVVGFHLNDEISDNSDGINKIILSQQLMSEKMDTIIYNVKSNVEKIDHLGKTVKDK